MSFDWLERTPRKHDHHASHASHERAAHTELADRAATLFRLGFSQHDAVRRLADRIAWEYDPPAGAHKRPEGLSDA
ncbi:MAG TPA: hypothetical protein VGC41_05100, partial [Kofleriaceae bacterium]